MSTGPGAGPGPDASARAILHLDMDAFYASVEQLRHPELRGRPVIVGGSGQRGVVAAASYEARFHGVHSAMPSVRARRLCPEAVFLDGDHAHYREVSARVMGLLREVTPLVEPLSLDEAFLDVSGTRRRLGDPVDTAHGLRAAVYDSEGLWCSVGVATNKFLAKLATGHAKPSASRTGPVHGVGVFEVPAGAELAFLHPLPVQDLWGVGPATLAKLHGIGVRTVGDLARCEPALLRSVLGERTATHLRELAHGVDERPVVADQRPKSISHEETFPRDRLSLAELRSVLVRHSDSVAARLRRAGLRGRTVQIKVRFGDFETITRSRTLEVPTDRGTDIVEVARALLEPVPVTRGVRLIGVGVTGFDDDRQPVVEQMSLLDSTDQDSGNLPVRDGPVQDAGTAWDAANHAVDEIRDRFGGASIRPARLLEDDGAGASPWGPAATSDPADNVWPNSSRVEPEK